MERTEVGNRRNVLKILRIRKQINWRRLMVHALYVCYVWCGVWCPQLN